MLESKHLSDVTPKLPHNMPHVELDLDVDNTSTPLSALTNHDQWNGHSRLASNVMQSDVDVLDGRIPKAVPETDEDEEDDDRPLSTDRHHGIDDGLLPVGEGTDVEVHKPHDFPKPRRPSFSFPGYNGTGFVTINGEETPIPDVNAYQHKKTLAQGMMDLALLSANANQLRYVLESYSRHPYYYPSLVFISLSIIFQIAVGVGLILNSRYNIKNEKDICHANKVNNYTVIGIFIVTVVNVFVSAFGVASPEQKT